VSLLLLAFSRETFTRKAYGMSDELEQRRNVETVFDFRMKAAIEAHGASTQAALWRLACYGIDSDSVGKVNISANSAHEIGASYWKGGKVVCTLHAVWDAQMEKREIESMRKGERFSPLMGWSFHQ
jgi:putative copper export protein